MCYFYVTFHLKDSSDSGDHNDLESSKSSNDHNEEDQPRHEAWIPAIVVLMLIIIVCVIIIMYKMKIRICLKRVSKFNATVIVIDLCVTRCDFET